MKKITKIKRAVGRHKDRGGDEGRAALLAAGAIIFSKKGYAATKIAELAKEAGVTPAMVHYYFGGKEKLLEAVLAEAHDPLMAEIEHIDTLEELVTAFHGVLLKYRWLPHLMHREVLSEGGHLTEMFMARYGSKFVPKWLGILAAEKTAGRLRADVNEFRHMIFLIALLVHPFLMAHLNTPFHEEDFTDKDFVDFRDDALKMFRQGTAP